MSFRKRARTLFVPWEFDSDKARSTRRILEEKTGERFPFIPLPGPPDPKYNDGRIVGAITRENPDQSKLHLIAGSNYYHDSTFYFADYFSGFLDLIYVHIDLHPDATSKDFGLGSFVRYLRRKPSVTKTVMIGYSPCEANNYPPYGRHDYVFGPRGMGDFSMFSGMNVYASVDGDSQRDFRGHMQGGDMTHDDLKRNLEGIASEGNIVGIDMTGFCRLRYQFEPPQNLGPYPDQWVLFENTFNLTRDVLNA
ncbi:MAG: hypothetical protein ABH879_02630 [archaeon]